MNQKAIGIAVTLATAAAAIVAFGWWLTAEPDRLLARRVPRGKAYWEGDAPKRAAKVANPGTLTAGVGKPSAAKGSWPHFRGPGRDAIYHGETRLAATWPESGLPVLWKRIVGEGHAGVAVHRGRVYLIDYDRRKQEDAIRCLSLDDGAEIWRYTYSVPVKRNHGMSRTIPAVTDRFVVAIGPKCHVHCLDADSGKLIWKFDLVEDYGTTVPPWYTGQCALVDGDLAILAPGGRALLIAVELATGNVKWETPNPDGWEMSHCSIAIMERPEGRQYIYSTTKGVAGVEAATGKLLWRWPDWRINIAAVATPLPVDKDRIFFSGGYGAGSVMARLNGQGEATTVEEEFRLKPAVFGSAQQTPILYDGHIYGVIPNGEMVCLGLDGKQRWASGSQVRFGLGPYMLAGGRLLVLSGMKCELHAFEAKPDACRPVARVKVLDGHDAWAPMALAGGRLILRDLTQLVCLDLREAP